jgi:hypothetical protein
VGVVFLVGAGLAVLLAAGRNTDEGDHIMRRIEGIGFGGAGESETERQRKTAWWSGLRSMPQHLIIGTGIGTGNSRSTGQGFEVTHYESYPLAVANEAGIFGLVIGLYPFFLPFFLPARLRGLPLGTRLFLHYSSALSLILIAMNPSAFAFEYACLALYKVALLRTAGPMRNGAAPGARIEFPQRAPAAGSGS